MADHMPKGDTEAQENQTKTEEQTLEEMVKEKQDRVNVFNDIVYKLVNFYFAFQGAILAVVLKSSLECDDMWIVYILYASVALFNLIALWTSGLTLAEFIRERDIYKKRLKHIREFKAANRDPGDDYKYGVTYHRYHVAFGICMAFFLLFTAFLYYAAYWKHCGKGSKVIPK